MNILLFVMTMLMLLTVMTYGRLESFRGNSFVQVQFKEYMEKSERSYANEEARKRYQSEKGSTKGPNEENNNKNPASSKLSFNLFIDKEAREQNAALLETQISLTQNLLYFLYGDQPFYTEVENKRSDILNEIIDALMRAADELTPEEKLNTKKVKEIATIDLGNEELNEVFTRMLKGSVEKEPEKEDEEKTQSTYKPVRGYYSLLDFITIEKNKLTIRVFLASPQLLMAIYGNEQVVGDIIALRYQLYRQLVNEEITVENAEQEFKSRFENLQQSEVPNDTLDFGVSKTNPNNYL